VDDDPLDARRPRTDRNEAEREETSGRISQRQPLFLVRVENCEVSESEAQPIRAGVALR
jgi:hypothetical protein